MKHNGYNIISVLLKEEDESNKINPLDLTSAVADKVIDVTEKYPRKRLGNWTAQHIAKAIKHLVNKKKESESESENKLKGV